MLSFSKRAMGAVLLAVPVAVALGVLRAHLGCGGATPRRGVENADAGVVDGGVVGEGGSDGGVGDAAAVNAGGAGCERIVTLNVDVLGSFLMDEPSVMVLGGLASPSLVTRVTDYHIPSIPPRKVVQLAPPFFATEFATTDMCAMQEVSSSYMRIMCLSDENVQTRTVDIRIEEGGRSVAIRVDGMNWYSDTLKDSGLCFTLATNIKRRDIAWLQRAYLHDGPSERCRTSTAPPRRVPATFVHEALPKGHEYYELGKPHRRSVPPYDSCRSVTRVRLILPPTVGASQDLGLLFAQCEERCGATRVWAPNRAEVGCFEGGSVSTYQLGDNLYIVEDYRVRQVPLPCNVKLDFVLTNFIKPLRILPTEIGDR